MKNKSIKFAGLAISIAVISACSAEFENPIGDQNHSTGTADFSQFVAVGDSLTAGYADNALYQSGQEKSMPAILAQQFSKAEGVNREFKQPLMNDNLGGLLFGGTANPEFGNRLVFDAATESPEPIAGEPTTEVLATAPLTGPFNNMGVPGAKSFHFGASGYGNSAGLLTDPVTANPYYARFASATDATVIGDAASQQPSFFVMWVGNNDALAYATSGGIGTDQNGNLDPTSYGSDDITDPTVFAGTYDQLIGAITAANPNAKGVLVNIPDVSTIPFFTTVPHNPVPLDQTTADALNDITAYGGYNAGLGLALQGGAITEEEYNRRLITFSASSNNALVIIDEDLTDLTGLNPALTNMRQATGDDLILLTSSSLIGIPAIAGDLTKLWGISAPFLDEHVLTETEVETVETARAAFNAKIKSTADGNANFLFYDSAAAMAELKNDGVAYGTGYIDANYVTGGGFSLDGVHPTSRGYAVVANQMIDVINTGFGANVPKVNPGGYSTVALK